ISPVSGQSTGGFRVAIRGSSFVSGARVYFGGALATDIVVASESSITASAPPHLMGTVDVEVENPDGQRGPLASAFTYVTGGSPELVEVDPRSGPARGGTSVTLRGSGFVSGATVTVGGSRADSVRVNSATSITFSTPPHVGGTVDVVLENPDGQTATLP